MRICKSGVALLVVVCVAGCGGGGESPRGWRKVPDREYPFGEPKGIPVEREYRLAVGDEMSFRVAFQEGLAAEMVVRPDGMVTIPVAGEVQAAGLTPSELDSVVTEKVSEYVIDPDVAIIVKKYSDRLVYVLGEVQTPGAYELRRGMTVSQAISSARGPTNIAKMTDVVLIRRETPYKATGVKLDIEHFFEDGNYEVDAQLRAYDIVYVPRTKIGTMSVWMDNFFRGWTHPLSLIVRGYDLIRITEQSN